MINGDEGMDAETPKEKNGAGKFSMTRVGCGKEKGPSFERPLTLKLKKLTPCKDME